MARPLAIAAVSLCILCSCVWGQQTPEPAGTPNAPGTWSYVTDGPAV